MASMQPCLLRLRMLFLATVAAAATIEIPLPYVSAANASAMQLLRLVACEDKDASCASWAAGGECNNNPGFMHSTCRASCNRCALEGSDASNARELCTYSVRNLHLAHREATAARPEMAGTAQGRTAGVKLARLLRGSCPGGEEDLRRAADIVIVVSKSICSGMAKWGTCNVPLPTAAPSAQMNGGSVSSDGSDRFATLPDGVQMPLVGVGTWLTVGDECYALVSRALRLGFRHIDTSENYMNAEQIGRSLADSSVPREQLFLADKLSLANSYTADGARAAITKSLAQLRTRYLDLYMLHSVGPSPSAMRTAWRQLEAFKREGLVRAIGVSNFGLREMREMAAFAEIQPATLQNKFSIFHPGALHNPSADDFLGYARSTGVTLVAYCPLNAWPSAIAPVADLHVQHIAAKNGKTPAQVLLRWVIQQGAAVLTRSRSDDHLQEASALFDFTLSQTDMDLLSGLSWLVLSQMLRPAQNTPDPLGVQALEAQIDAEQSDLRPEL